MVSIGVETLKETKKSVDAQTFDTSRHTSVLLELIYTPFHKNMTLYFIKNVTYFLYKMTLFNNFNKFKNSNF